jgi:hypothetical protein
VKIIENVVTEFLVTWKVAKRYNTYIVTC